MASKKRVAPRRISDASSTSNASSSAQVNGKSTRGATTWSARPSGQARSGSSRPGGRQQSGGRPSGPPPKPGTKASAKQRSRAAAIPVSRRRISPAMMGWVSGGLVVVLVAVFVIIAVTKSTVTNPGRVPVPAAIVKLVTNVPTSVLDEVGIGGQKAASAAEAGDNAIEPVEPATNTSADFPGKKPTVFYYGAEFCPYCATERWSLIIALSKFGTFTNLGGVASDANDVYPNTQTFTFYLSHYTSKYIQFLPVEAEDTNRNPLENPDAQETAVLHTWNPGLEFPFLDIGGKYIGGLPGWLNPGILNGLSRQQIAATLSIPTNVAGMGIDANANYLTAGICAVDGQQPADVCSSTGVTAAAAQLPKMPPAKPIQASS